MENLNQHSISFFDRRYESRHVIFVAFAVLCLNVAINIFNSLNGLDYPYTSFLLEADDRFGDFFKVIDTLGIVDTWGGETNEVNIYSRPFSSLYYFIFAELIILTGDKEIVYAVLCALIACLIFLTARRLGNKTIPSLLVIVSYPILFSLDRGNFAVVVFLLLLMAFTSESLVAATCFIAAAASLKLTPIVFLLPLILKEPVTVPRAVRSVAYTMGWIIILNLVATLLLSTTFTNQQGMDQQFASEMDYYRVVMVEGLSGLCYGSSLYMPMVWYAHQQGYKDFFTTYFKPATVVILVMGLIGILVLIKGEVRKMFSESLQYQKLLSLLSICFVLFMPVTADYYLAILFLPLLLFPKAKYSFVYVMVLGLALGAKNVAFMGRVFGSTGLFLSWQVFINPTLLLLLLFGEFNLLPFVRREPQPDGEQLSTWVSWRKVALITTSAMLISTLTVLTSRFVVEYREEAHRQHNIEMGLPEDFDPEQYLKLNPQIEDYWKSVGINDSGQALRDRAEDHYKAFGSKDGWAYK